MPKRTTQSVIRGSSTGKQHPEDTGPLQQLSLCRLSARSDAADLVPVNQHDPAGVPSDDVCMYCAGSNLDVLYGIRALACIAIVFGHCMFALGFAWPEQHPAWYSALEREPWMLALVNLSEPAMDIFLILSGFLAAGSLLPAMQSGKRPVQVHNSHSERASN
jgi:hypothetical protein